MTNTWMMTLVIATMAAISIGGLSYAVLSPLLAGRDRAGKRLRSITEGEKVSSAERAGLDKLKERKKSVQDTLKELEEKQKEEKKKISLRARIERAGLEMTPSTFYSISALFGLCVTIVFLIMQYNFAIVGAAGFAAALGVPRWVLSYLALRRQKSFLHEFANAIDIIVRGVKSGLPLNECLNIIANESPDPVGTEFRDLVEGNRVGVPLETGMERMYQRMPLPEVNFFAIVLALQAKTGGNLSEVLSNLSNVLRSRRRMQEKIQAMSSEAKASAGIIGSLPPAVMFLIYLTTPDYISLLFTERLGNVMLICCGLWMGFGVLVMKKMINFKF